ncbi:MAG: VF530 family protein [Saprospiraceae bacterium]|nr:VF530 family protein [Saprospiraceae bacterium]
MVELQKNNPLHGKTLEYIVTYLQVEYGWEGLHDRIPVKCFKDNPSIKSSLTFLRKTPWARGKVETLFVNTCL